MGVLVEQTRSLFTGALRSITPGSWSAGDRELTRLLFGDRTTAAGVPVNEQAVLGIPAVRGCLDIQTGGVRMCPLILYRELPDGSRERATDYHLYPVLHDAPNDEQDAAEFWSLVAESVILHGNALAEKMLDGAGRVRALIFIRWDRAAVGRDPTGRLIYRVSNFAGHPDVTLTADEVLHVRGGFSVNGGFTGQGVLQTSRDLFATALAMQQYAATFFGQGATMGGVISHPGHMTDPARESFRAYLARQHAGVDRAHRLLLLEEKMTYTPITATPEAAQLVEAQQALAEQCCRALNVPAHLLGVSRTGLTYTSSEHEAAAWVKTSLGPLLLRIAGAVNRALIPRLERGRFHAEFLTEGLLRASTLERYQAYRVGLGNQPFLDVEWVRRRESLPPMPSNGGAA